MTQIKIKRVYEDPEAEDGYRVLVVYGLAA